MIAPRKDRFAHSYTYSLEETTKADLVE